MGWDARLVEAVVSPPPLVRAALVAVAVLLALAAFRRGIVRISEGRGPAAGDALAGDAAARDREAGVPAAGGRGPAAGTAAGGPAALIRGVRLVFLSLAGIAAAAGWLVGHPLPLIAALVIAAVDVLETTFLLVVLGTRRIVDRD
jgi:hypothetical protein